MACVENENSLESPRFSFSVNLSSTDRTSPEKRRKDVPDVNYSTEFEFTIVSNVNVASFEETLISADELFVDGKILPQIPSFEPQGVRIARHRSLRNFTESPSPAGSMSFSPSKPGNPVSKSGYKFSAWWKEIFKVRNKEYSFDGRESSNVKAPRSGRLVWLFSTCGGGNGLFCAFPFCRSKSAVERNKPVPCLEVSCTSVGAQAAFKETQGSKPAGTAGLTHEGVISATKGLPDLVKAKDRPRKVLRRRSPARNSGRGSPGRFVVRNLERCGGKGFDSPRKGRKRAEGLVKSNCNDSKVRLNPVLNVPAFMCPAGSKYGAGLFGFTAFFSRRESITHHQAA